LCKRPEASIDRSRLAARKFAPLDRVVFVGVERVLVGKPAQNFARLQP
jgi:hypothetical protein